MITNLIVPAGRVVWLGVLLGLSLLPVVTNGLTEPVFLMVFFTLFASALLPNPIQLGYDVPRIPFLACCIVNQELVNSTPGSPRRPARP